MTNNIFVLKGDLNGENHSGAFLFLSGIISLYMYLRSNTCINIMLSIKFVIFNEPLQR